MTNVMMMRRILRKVGISLCCRKLIRNARIVALLTPSLLAQAPNIVPVCAQACYVDSNTNPAAVYQYGDGRSAWGNTFTATYPLYVNYTNTAALGIPPNWTGGTPTTLYVQQTTFTQTIKVHNLDPTSWTVTIPPVPVSTGTSATGTAAASIAASVTLPSQTGTTAPIVIPKMSGSCTVPRNGGPCTITFQPQTLNPIAVTIPGGQTVPINTVPMMLDFACSIPKDADGNLVLAGVACTAKVRK